MIFQSTLPRGERQSEYNSLFSQIKFQSTLPRGERPISNWKNGVSVIFQSTLPRGERRRLVLWNREVITYFNPRSHEGSDLVQNWHLTALWVFQSTLPRGERRYTASKPTDNLLYFNPRSHEGSDDNGTEFLDQQALISIHAPTRGATYNRRKQTWYSLFQSTLPRGERRLLNESSFS